MVFATMLERTPPRCSRALESLAFDLMVGADVLGMLASARDAEDASEIASALARLCARGETVISLLDERSGSSERRLAHELTQVLDAFEAAARAARDGLTPVAREVVLLARRGSLELARSVQSLADLWAAPVVAAHGVQLAQLAAESARTSGAPRAGAAAEALDGVLVACVRAQRLATAMSARVRTAG